ncbi:MAG: aldo/keto reductase [Deinococcota bacterium]
MNYGTLGSLKNISKLSLGGGGIANVWGAVERQEAIATVHLALEAGINLFDMAPGYGDGEAEDIIAESFLGKPPQHVSVTSKCWLQNTHMTSIATTLRESLERSLERMKLAHVDIFFLHNPIIPDAQVGNYEGVSYSHFNSEVVPTLESLVAEGLTKHWGITGVGVPQVILQILESQKAPSVIQALTNPTNSAATLKTFDEPTQARNIIQSASQKGIGVMGIRAVGAGAFTDTLDRTLSDTHPVMQDYKRAQPFRSLAKELGVSAAYLAHQYALSMSGVSTVVLGAKNRIELQECIEAEKAGQLSDETIDKIDSLW